MELLIIVGMFGALYLLLIRPQQRRERERRALVQSLVADDEVVTNAGIHGVIVEVEEDIVWIEVAPDVELKITRDAVTRRTTQVSSEAADSSGDSKSDSDGDK